MYANPTLHPLHPILHPSCAHQQHVLRVAGTARYRQNKKLMHETFVLLCEGVVPGIPEPNQLGKAVCALAQDDNAVGGWRGTVHCNGTQAQMLDVGFLHVLTVRE